MSPLRLAWTTCELSVLALALGVAVTSPPRAMASRSALQPVQVPPAAKAPSERPQAEGPLELRTLVLHPDMEESFPAHACEAQGLPDEEADCNVPPLMT